MAILLVLYQLTMQQKHVKLVLSHNMDTADFNAEGIKPQVIENYAGGAIELGQSG